MKKQSFRAALNLWVVGITIAIIAITIAACTYFAAREAQKNVHLIANAQIDNAIGLLDSEMAKAEVSALNFAVQSHFKEVGFRPDSVYAILERFLERNPHLFGVAVGYEPDYVPHRPLGFAPYVLRSDSGFVRNDLLEISPYHSRPWYSETLHQPCGHWSGAFVESSGRWVITSYCLPIADGQGRRVGVVALDVCMDMLGDTLQSLNPYPNSMLSVVDRDGRFVAHPTHSYILNETIASLIEKNGTTADSRIMKQIAQGIRGTGQYRMDGSVRQLYYAGAKHVDWTVILDVPRNDISGGFHSMLLIMIAIMVVGVLLVLAVCSIAISRLTRPIALFTSSARQIASGNFHAYVPEVEYTDLHQLQEALVMMERSIDQYVADLKSTTESKAQIQGELNIAHRIQMALVPKIFPPFPNRNDMDLYASLIPAKAVGGDLYDYYIHDDNLIFCIGDVSGKGIPGALMMAITRSLFRNIAMREHSPAAIATSLNNAISEHNDENMFVTMFIGSCNLKTGELTCCNCGHNLPAVAFNGCDFHFIDSLPTNLPIGVVAGFEYAEVTSHIAPGTQMLLYTDGITEAENARKELFGNSRLLQALPAHEASPRSNIQAVLDRVSEFVQGEEQSDDITLLCIQFRGESLSLTLRNSVDEMQQLQPFVYRMAEAWGIDDSKRFQLYLALDEAVSNVVKYAYPAGCEGTIKLTAQRLGRDIILTLADVGQPFDPTASTPADTTLGVAERPIGGLGIHLIKQMMDQVSYHYTDNMNILTMKINIL